VAGMKKRKKENQDNVASVKGSYSLGNIIINCYQAKRLSNLVWQEGSYAMSLSAVKIPK